MDKVALPEEWVETSLATLVTIIRGVTYKKSQAELTASSDNCPVLRANNIQNGKLVLDDLVYVDTRLIKEQQKVQKNDIVIAMSSGSKSVVGKAAQAKEDINAGFGAFCGLLRPNRHLDASLISFFTASADYRNKISMLSAGANINNLKPAHFNDITYPLPPLAEQKVIADKLDTLLAQVENTKARLTRIGEILKQFRQSILAAAVSGRLTTHWREEQIGVLRWKKLILADVAIWGSGGTPSRKRSDFYGGNIPWVKTGDLGDKVLYKTSEYITEIGLKSSSAKYFPQGAVAIAMYGATIGKTSILGIAATTNQACTVGNPINGIVTSEYLYYFLVNEKDHFVAKGKGGAQPNISQSIIKNHDIRLPPLEEQTEIVHRVEALFAHADHIESQVQAAMTRVEKLTPSILAKAFRGELTADWRAANPDLISGENSAAALLAKIEAERKASKTTRSKRK